jgi:hypothetical protein
MFTTMNKLLDQCILVTAPTHCEVNSNVNSKQPQTILFDSFVYPITQFNNSMVQAMYITANRTI